MGKIVVIGSNSFAGSHFIDYLLSNTDSSIIGISRRDEKKDVFLPYKKNRNLERFRFQRFDLNKNMAELLKFLDDEKPEVIVNYAAQSEVAPSWENPLNWYDTNVSAVVKLTNHLKGQKYLKNYVHVSSPEIYGTCYMEVYEDHSYNPSTPYAASKAAGDMFIQLLAKNFNFPAIIVRPTNYYGPCQQLFKIIPKSIIYLKKGEKIPLHGGGRAVKSFIHIRDVCDGMLKIVEKGKAGEIYHLSQSSGYSVRKIVEKICSKMGKKFNEATDIVEERLGQDASYIISSYKARKLNWEPKIGIDEGLAECIKWVEDNWSEIKTEPLKYIHEA
ncbi:GDP-mannose 4,6-dehydratase [Candidatus Woesearchaeota archaeon]|nr:GDP-mannose 4,6-dehydratase [Candidatus Woesearchaeota archaeon]